MNVMMANQFLLGVLVTSCASAGLFFLRFWRRTADGLFLAFALAFWMLGLNWLLLAIVEKDEVRTALYVIRLLAFVLILGAILQKNRRGRTG